MHRQLGEPQPAVFTRQFAALFNFQYASAADSSPLAGLSRLHRLGAMQQPLLLLRFCMFSGSGILGLVFQIWVAVVDLLT